MPQRNVATNFTFEQQRLEINLLAQDFWAQKGTVDTASTTYLKHDGSNAFTGQTLAVPNAFTINPNSGGGTVTIAGNLDVTGTTTTVSSANLEVTDKNILIAKGSTSDSQADGAGITIDSATDITWNFVDAKDAWVSSIGVEATTTLKVGGVASLHTAQFTGTTAPTAGSGVEIGAPDANTGQVIVYDRDNSAYKQLNLKGSSVQLYGGTTNALVGTFNSTGLTMESGKNITCPGNLDVDGNSTFGANGSITSGGNFTLNGNGFVVTGSQTAVGEFKGATIPTIQITQTTDTTDLQLRANSTGGLVRTAGAFPLILGTAQEERLRIHQSNAFVTVNHGNAENNSALILSKVDAGYAKLEFDVGTSQKAYIELDASESLVHYGAAGTQQLFYAGGSTALTIDTSQNAIFNGSVVIPARRNSGGTLETGTSDNWFKIGTISTFGGGNRIRITILGTNGYGQTDEIVGHTIINITRDNGSTQGVRGHFYGVGTTDSYPGVSEVATKPTGTSNQFDVYVKPSGHYQNLGSFVDISTGAGTWAGATTDTGSTSQPASSNLLQKDWGLLLGGSRKLGIDTSGNATFAGQVKVSASNATTVAFSVGDAGTGFYNSGSNAIGYSVNGTQKWNIDSSGNLDVSGGTISDSKGSLRRLPQNNQSGGYNLVAADAGKHINTTGDIGLYTGQFEIGDAVTIFNKGAAAIAIGLGGGITMYQAGTTNVGNRGLDAKGICTILCTEKGSGTNTFVISGAGLT